MRSNEIVQATLYLDFLCPSPGTTAFYAYCSSVLGLISPQPSPTVGKTTTTEVIITDSTLMSIPPAPVTTPPPGDASLLSAKTPGSQETQIGVLANLDDDVDYIPSDEDSDYTDETPGKDAEGSEKQKTKTSSTSGRKGRRRTVRKKGRVINLSSQESPSGPMIKGGNQPASTPPPSSTKLSLRSCDSKNGKNQ